MTRAAIRNSGVAAVLVVTLLVVSGHASHLVPPTDGRRLGSHESPASTAPVASPVPGRDPEALPRGSRRDRLRVIDATMRFTRALLRYEAGIPDQQVRLDLRRTCSRSLLRALLEQPPRRPVGSHVPASTLIAVRAVRVQGHAGWSIAILRRGHRAAGMALTLERAPDRFLVTAVD